MKSTLIVCVFSLLATAAGAAETAPPAPAATPTPAPAAAAAAAAPTAASPTTAAPPAPAAPATPTAAPLGATADEEYGLKMKELEDSVAELKEQIFRSKAKLTLLTEQVQGGTGAGARIVVNHKNMMGANFLLVEVDYFLDGTPLWQEVDEKGAKLSAMKEHPLWDGNIIEGSHTLTVELKYRGNGTGVFQYLQGYAWTLKDSVSFTAEPAKLLTIDVVAFEKGNFTTEMTERPGIRFDQNVRADVAKKAKK
jgi:hypothetical protein